MAEIWPQVAVPVQTNTQGLETQSPREECLNAFGMTSASCQSITLLVEMVPCFYFKIFKIGVCLVCFC